MEEKKKYLLKGDISGIQEYIFNVQSKGVAKALKARSYYVSVISDLCFNYCCKKLKNVRISVEPIFSGGGNFFIQITGDDLDEKVKELQQQLNNELLHDDISIVLTLEDLDENNFGASWIALLLKSNKEKLKQYKDNYALFEPYPHEEKERNKERFASYKIGTEHNDLYKNIIDRMVKSKVIETVLFDEQFLEGMLDFENRLSNKLPFWEDYDKLEDYKEYRKENYGEDYLIKNDKNLTDFDAFGDFAAQRTGTNKLAILKMDVDNLGLIFRDHVHSLADAQELSKQFQDFFDKQLFTIWEQDEFKANIYPVFVGGDDCFIVGGWDKVLPFAKAINDAFQIAFKDKGYSLSAGIVIVDPKHPVVSFAELAEDALSDAKNKNTFFETFSKVEKHMKNCISIFDEVFTWSEFDKVLEVLETVIPYLESGEVNRSVLEKLRNSAKGFHALQQQILKEDHINIPQLWRLKYYLGKKSNNNKFKKVEDKLFTPYETALQSALIKKEGVNPAIFPVAARLIEFSTKKKLTYDGDN